MALISSRLHYYNDIAKIDLAKIVWHVWFSGRLDFHHHYFHHHYHYLDNVMVSCYLSN